MRGLPCWPHCPHPLYPSRRSRTPPAPRRQWVPPAVPGLHLCPLPPSHPGPCPVPPSVPQRRDPVGTSVHQARHAGTSVPGQGLHSLQPPLTGGSLLQGPPHPPAAGQSPHPCDPPLQHRHTMLQSSLPSSVSSAGPGPRSPRGPAPCGLTGVSADLLGTGRPAATQPRGQAGNAADRTVTSAAAFSSSCPFPPGSP